MGSGSVRHKKADRDDNESIQDLLVTLDDAPFVYRTQVEYTLDTAGMISSRKLIQIWFAHRKQLFYAQRFAAKFVMLIDGTFNINKLRLSLLVCVGITNTDKTFPM